MKIYILTIDEIDDFEVCPHEPEAYLTKAEAEKHLKKYVKLVEKEFGKRDYEIDITETSVSAYRDGSHCQSHFDVTLNEIEVQGKPFLKLNVVYGENASGEAACRGFKTVAKEIRSGEMEGSADEYAFETEHDRELAITILGAHDGWLGNYWEKVPIK